MKKSIWLALILTVSYVEAQTKPRKKNTEPYGYAIAPLVFADEDCARDYVRAFRAGGLELRKKIEELRAYKCLNDTAKAVFSGETKERKNLATEKGREAYFRHVTLLFDAGHTRTAISGSKWGSSVEVHRPPMDIYEGWIMDSDFYPIESDQLDTLLSSEKIQMRITDAWKP
jgi:hypothetical protein